MEQDKVEKATEMAEAALKKLVGRSVKTVTDYSSDAGAKYATAVATLAAAIILADAKKEKHAG
jgi:hypothetical protein